MGTEVWMVCLPLGLPTPPVHTVTHGTAQRKESLIFTNSQPGQRTTGPDNSRRATISQTFEVNTINIEGVKGNAPFLISLAKNSKIICIQETWFRDFEKEAISNIIPDYEGFLHCADMYGNISNFQARGGKGGVAIIWPKEWSSKIVQLDEGNERIIAMEIQCSDERPCIVNAYMSTLNLPKSKTEYQVHIDILHCYEI